MAKVSIIMPVKNAAHYLVACMASIQAQTFQDWELIAIDDHSTDVSPELLSKAAASDSRIVWQKNDGNGIISALQQALLQARGEYITRMDADDLMTHSRLELMTSLMERSTMKTVVTGLVKYFADSEVSEGYQRYETWLNDTNLTGSQWKRVYRECVIASPNWMVRTHELVNMQAFDNLEYPEDYHLVMQWYQKGFKVECIPTATLLWREHDTRTSKTSAHYSQEAFFALKIKKFLEIEQPLNNLVLWGGNKKAKLVKKILDAQNVHYKWLHLADYKELETITAPKVLLAVYPEQKERQQMENYLLGLGFLEGAHWWYL